MRTKKDLARDIAEGAHKLNVVIQLLVFMNLLLLVPTDSFASRTSYTGLSGLPFMNTADTLGRRELDFHFREGAEKFEQNGFIDHVGKSALGVTYGLLDGLEVAAQLPHSYKEGRGYSGVPYFTVASKYRFLGGRNKPYAVAISATGNVGAAAVENNIGSGENGYSVELNASLYGGTKVAWHLMLGREKSDRKNLNTANVAAGTFFESVTKNKMAVGFEYEMDPDLFLTMEAEGTVTTEDEDDNGIYSLGLRYQADTALTYTLAMGLGLPDERSQPQVRVLAGIAYSYGKPHAPTRATPSPTRPRHARSNEPRTVVPTTPTPAQQREGYKVRADIHNVPPAVKAPQARPAPRVRPQVAQAPKQRPARTVKQPAPPRKYVSNVRIEVWNASGIKGLATKVANRLKQKGYRVVRVKTSRRRQKQTMVFYSPGYSKQAVEVGHAIWKNQDVRGTSKLKKGIEVQIVVGYDLEK